jgi:hypothetical protein
VGEERFRLLNWWEVYWLAVTTGRQGHAAVEIQVDSRVPVHLYQLLDQRLNNSPSHCDMHLDILGELAWWNVQKPTTEPFPPAQANR